MRALRYIAAKVLDCAIVAVLAIGVVVLFVIAWVLGSPEDAPPLDD